MAAGTRFDWHTHEDHQLHETASDGGRATMRSLYIRPGLFPASWTETGRPTPVAASSLLAELIGYLREPDLEPGPRRHAEALLADLLAPVPVTTIGVRLPSATTAWRTLLRLQAALSMLASGEPVSRVAGRVGYETPSAFVAAFRRETGQTPGTFFRT
jgi:Helix-turn-helix domain